MPIFEYVCRDCGKTFELIVRSGSGEPECPHCGSRGVAKKFSSFAVASAPARRGCAASDAAPCPHGGCGCGPGCCHGK